MRPRERQRRETGQETGQFDWYTIDFDYHGDRGTTKKCRNRTTSPRALHNPTTSAACHTRYLRVLFRHRGDVDAQMGGVARAPLRCALVALFVAALAVVSFPSASAAGDEVRGGEEAAAAAAAAAAARAHVIRGGVGEEDDVVAAAAARGGMLEVRRHRRLLRKANPAARRAGGDGNAAMDGTNPFEDASQQLRTFSVQDQRDDPEIVTGFGAGPGDLGYDPMNIRSRVAKSSEALDIEDGTRSAIDSVTAQAAAGEFGDGSALQDASNHKTLTPEEEARAKMIEQGRDVASIISASNEVKEHDEDEADSASLAINSVAADDLVRATEVDPRDDITRRSQEEHRAVAAANTARAAAAKEENVQQELRMLENLMLQEMEVKRKLDASFQSKVAEEMEKSKAAIEDAKKRERQLKVRELELEVRLEKQMREQNAQLTSASVALTRQMSEAARQQQYMASEALRSAARAQAAAAEAQRGSVAKAIDYVKNKNVTAAMEKIRALRAGIAESIRSKEAIKTKIAEARGKVANGFNAGYETVQTQAEAARPAIVKLAESRESLRNKIKGVRETTAEHKRVVDEKFAAVVAPRLRSVSDNTGLTLAMDGATLTNAHKKLSQHVAGALKGYNIIRQQHDAAAEIIAFLTMLLPLLGWLGACGYMLYKAARLGYSSLPDIVYFGNMFWCAYFGILFSIVFFLGQEPLADFHHSHPEDYLVFQFLKALLFCGHALLCLLLAVLDFKYYTLGQLCAVVFVASHYYANAWVLAMMDHPPKLGLMSYALYLWLFGMMLSMPKSKLGQKQNRE